MTNSVLNSYFISQPDVLKLRVTQEKARTEMRPPVAGNGHHFKKYEDFSDVLLSKHIIRLKIRQKFNQLTSICNFSPKYPNIMQQTVNENT